MTTTTLAAESSAGNPILNISIFGIFLFITMAVVLRAGKTTKKASDSVSYTHLRAHET